MDNIDTVNKYLGFSNWSIDLLGNISKIIYGESPKDILDENGDFLVVGTGNDIRKGNDYLIDGEAVIIGRKGTIDKPYYYLGRIWVIDTAYYLITNDSIIPKYLYYFLCTFNLQNLNSSTGVPSLSRTDLEKIKIYFPLYISEQRKIASILTTVDNVIEKTEAAIEKYKSIKQGMMHDLFTRGIDPKTNKLRPKYEQIPELYKQTKFGFIPSDWKLQTTKDLLYIKGRIGWRGLKKEEFIEHGPYLITGMHFIDDKIDWNNCFHINKHRYEESPEIIVKVGDVLFTKDGTIGKVAFIDHLPGEASLNSHLLLLRPISHNLNSKYFYYELLFTRFRNYIENYKSGSTLAGLSQSIFEKYLFPLPSQQEQDLIFHILSSVDNKIDHEKGLLIKYNKIKRGLMQDLLTGKKRVKLEHKEELREIG